MENTTFKDFTINIKKSLDRDYYKPEYDEEQKMVNEHIISSIENSYRNDEEDEEAIMIDHSYDDDSDLIEPNKGMDCVNLVKVKSIPQLERELRTLLKVRMPLIVDFDYIQKRRPSDIKRVGNILNKLKEEEDANVVLLGSTKNVVVITTPEINLIR